MAKSDKKIHEYRMSGAKWILDLAKSEGIEVAEDELKKRGAMFIPLDISKDTCHAIEKEIAERMYTTILTSVMGILIDEYGFGKKRLTEFKDKFDSFCDKFFYLQSDGTPYVRISDYARLLKEEYGISMDVDLCTEIEKSREEQGKI